MGKNRISNTPNSYGYQYFDPEDYGIDADEWKEDIRSKCVGNGDCENCNLSISCTSSRTRD